jgi:hypothetical protein
VSERNVVKAGFSAKRLRARYDYTGNAVIHVSLLHISDGDQTIDRSARVRTDGNDVAIYASDRAAITPHFVLEAGVRADAQSYAPDGTHVAPRINAAFSLGERAKLRASWGRFYQAQGLNEVQVEDRMTTFLPAERADHALLGLEYDFGAGYSGRAEVYDKRFTQLRPRYENIFDRIVIFPELHADRFRIDAPSGRARGGELLLRKVGTPLSGWISLGRASARDIIDDGSVSIEVPRAWDQRITATFNVDYRRREMELRPGRRLPQRMADHALGRSRGQRRISYGARRLQQRTAARLSAYRRPRQSQHRDFPRGLQFVRRAVQHPWYPECDLRQRVHLHRR